MVPHGHCRINAIILLADIHNTTPSGLYFQHCISSPSMHTGIQVNRKRPSARELIVFKWKRGQQAVLVPIYESRWTSHYRIIAHAHYSYMEIICYVLLATFFRRTWSCRRKATLLDRRRTIQVTKLLLTHYHDRIRFSSYIFQYIKKRQSEDGAFIGKDNITQSSSSSLFKR